MKIQIGQIYNRKHINRQNNNFLVVDIKKHWFLYKITLHVFFTQDTLRYFGGYTFNISKGKFLKQFEFNEKLTNEYLIKSIIK